VGAETPAEGGRGLTCATGGGRDCALPTPPDGAVSPDGGVHIWPHVGHGSGDEASDAPQLMQKRAPSARGVPQDPQKPDMVTALPRW
jgi:hypothetical protein